MADHIHRGQLRDAAIPDFRAPARVVPPGYDAMPLTNQWAPQRGEPVDKSTWRPCHACEHLIPVQRDWIDQNGRRQHLDTWSYVCPACHATQRGSVHDGVDPQTRCHGCKTQLAGDGAPCAACGLLRGWAVASCPHCGLRQAVCMPHLAAMCDFYRLQCYGCELLTVSLCIC